MVDPTIKLLLMSSPKAGATLVERLMLARVNLTGAAVHFKGYPLRYSHEVFQQAKGRLPTPGHLASCAPGTGWLCVAIVRNPLDRAISSYIFTMRHYGFIASHFQELDGNADASFAEFAAALDRRARKKASHSPGDGHFMPQSVPTKTGALRPGVLYVPIEMLTRPGGYACHSLARVLAFRVSQWLVHALGRHCLSESRCTSKFVTVSLVLQEVLQVWYPSLRCPILSINLNLF